MRMAIDKSHSRQHIIEATHRLMLEKGLKSLAMDLVAAELAMSKRTLYEIFESKHNLISEVIAFHFDSLKRRLETIFQSSPNMMVAMVEAISLQSGKMCEVTFRFFHDMDKLYPEIHNIYRTNLHKQDNGWLQIYHKGVEEGVFRKDVDAILMLRILHVQMEALKRMDPTLLGEFSLSNIYDTIAVSFLRSIGTLKGIEILENYLAKTT